MALTKVLIAVKTYPNLSTTYDELVCTAGFKEDGSWVRIYPVQFRNLDYEKQYRKYQWIEIDLEKNTSDPRPESFRPRSYDTIKMLGEIDTKNNWSKRKDIVLKNTFRDLNEIIDLAHKNSMSLAVFKPERILDFVVEKTEREWDSEKVNTIIEKRKQLSFFDVENKKELPRKLPYKFSYHFEDIRGVKSILMIEDWELGQLYWNCLKRHNGDEQKAIQDVRSKYFEDFAKTKDLYLFLGTTREFHIRKARNPYVITGVFYPPMVKRGELTSLFG
jgi:hypothetical protein